VGEKKRILGIPQGKSVCERRGIEGVVLVDMDAPVDSASAWSKLGALDLCEVASKHVYRPPRGAVVSAGPLHDVYDDVVLQAVNPQDGTNARDVV
jgi:hypothetical protein